MKPHLVLLASYPKSGNTWLRLVLNNLLRGGDQPVQINEMDITLHGDRRRLFDHYSPWPSSDLDDAEIDRLWPEVYRQFNAELSQLEFLKCHSRALINKQGEYVFPSEVTKAVLHLVRHPFDVAVSFAYHFGLPLDVAVDKMIAVDADNSKNANKWSWRLPEKWGSWQQHYTSWRDVAETHHVVTMRYEDLLTDPHASFFTLLKATGVDLSNGTLARALEHSRFESLQKQEAENGFREFSFQNRPFFRTGRSNTWQGQLTDTMRQKLIMNCRDAMMRLGYGEAGEVQCISTGDIKNEF